MPEIILASAGSLAPALSEFADRFASEAGHAVRLRSGPAGLLTQEILKGMPADVFVSASPQGPAELWRKGLYGQPRTIGRNRMVLVVHPDVETSRNSARALLADPRWRIGMSTPGADPSGDYTAAFLDRLIATDPFRWRGLRDRCVSLYGAALPDGPAPPRSPAVEALCSRKADMLIAYATTAGRIAEALPGAKILPLPPEIALPTEICACVRSGAPDPARRLFEALQRPECATILRRHGFIAA
ncbi:MAG: substrate-binding domain-containing protein [Paracoccus sp. (in: a-proteobacteria)]|uniref:substrate-binding domain-containing protein n=1 Tax=Paracoccus sp. TaxID=267 RepID=UPI0039E4463D